MATDREALLAELKQVESKASDQYWQFCRCAQARPVDPALTRRASEIRELLGIKKPFWDLTKEQVFGMYGMPEQKHKQYVEKALLDGKTIPEHVLAQYPELKEPQP